MKLLLQTMKRVQYEVEVEENATIGQVKETLEKIHCVGTAATQKLIYLGEVLKNDRCVSQINFKAGHDHLVLIEGKQPPREEKQLDPISGKHPDKEEKQAPSNNRLTPAFGYFCQTLECWQRPHCLIHGQPTPEHQGQSTPGHASFVERQPTQPDPHQERKVSSAFSELTDTSREFLSNIAGFLECKHKVEATAMEVLPHKWMSRHDSFSNADLLIQKNVNGQKVQSLQEVFTTANLAKPIFENVMRGIVEASGLNPDEVVQFNGKNLMLDEKTAFKVLLVAPLKGEKRCVEKVEKEYKNDYSCLLDVVRCSIVVYTEAELEVVATAFAKTDAKQYVVARLKNRFKKPLFNGYRDALYSITINCGNGVTHVCEVQLHLAAVLAHKEESHEYYVYFRTYFAGSGVEEKRMDALSKIKGFGNDVDLMLTSVLGGANLGQLNALAELLGEYLMGEVHISVLVWKRIFDLTGSVDAQTNYARALHVQGKLKEPEAMFRKVLLRNRQAFGNHHENTLHAMNNLALVLKEQGKLEIAENLYRESLAGLRRLPGNVHLAALTNLSIVLDARGNLDEAALLSLEALDLRMQLLGNLNPDTLAEMDNLGQLLVKQGRLEEAERVLQAARTTRTQQLGSMHPDTLRSIHNLGMLAEAKLEKIQAKRREAGRSFWDNLLECNPDDLFSERNPLAVFLNQNADPEAQMREEKKHRDEAESLLREAMTGRSTQLGKTHVDSLHSMHNLANLLVDHNPDEAKNLFETVLAARFRQLGNHQDTFAAMVGLANCYLRQERYEEAETRYRNALAGLRGLLGDMHANTLLVVSNLIVVLKKQMKWQEAELLAQELVAARMQQGGADHQDTVNARKLLESVLRRDE